MPREIPASVVRELNRQDSPEFYLAFLTISHPQFADAIRVVSDPRNFMLATKEHIGFQFDIRLLTDNEAAPFAQLTIQNVDKRIPEGILKAVSPARVHIEVFAGSEFNLDETPGTEKNGPGTAVHMYNAPQLYLTEVEADSLQITARIVSWDYTQELWPGTMATKNRFPGLFR